MTKTPSPPEHRVTLSLHVPHLKPIKQNAATPEGEQDPEQTQRSPSSGTDQSRVQTLHKAVPDITDILPEGEGSSRVSGLLPAEPSPQLMTDFTVCLSTFRVT